MDPADFETFTLRWLTIRDMYRHQAPPEHGTRLVFAALSEFTLAEIELALSEIIKHAEYLPTPADVTRQIIGPKHLDAELVYALALRAETPLGLWVSSTIGTQLGLLSEPDGLRRVRMYRPKINGLRHRALVGQYSDSELRLFRKHAKSPILQLAPDVPGTRIPYRAQLIERLQALPGPTAGSPTPAKLH